jgi:hypothetical protein
MMPLIIGLVGDEMMDQAVNFNATFPVTLDDLSTEELAALEAEADQALASGMLDRINIETTMNMPQAEGDEMMGQRIELNESAADEAAESPEEQAAEQAAGTELHSTTEFVEQAQAGYEECEQMLEQLQEMANTLGEEQDVGDLLEEMESAVKEAKEVADEAESALEDDDIHAAADAANKMEELKGSLTDAMSQVESMRQESDAAAAASAPVAPKEGTPARPSPNPPMMPPKSPGCNYGPGAGKAEAPLAMWAKRMVSPKSY